MRVVHRLAECAALCTRLAIMVNGKFRCIGTPRHLKKKYGGRSTLTIHTRDTGLPSTIDLLKEFIAKTYPDSRHKDERMNILAYLLPTKVTLAEVFTSLEKVKSLYDIDYYSVRQTTLEDIIVRFAPRRHSKSAKRRNRVFLESFKIIS